MVQFPWTQKFFFDQNKNFPQFFSFWLWNVDQDFTWVKEQLTLFQCLNCEAHAFHSKSDLKQSRCWSTVVQCTASNKSIPVLYHVNYFGLRKSSGSNKKFDVRVPRKFPKNGNSWIGILFGFSAAEAEAKAATLWALLLVSSPCEPKYLLIASLSRIGHSLATKKRQPTRVPQTYMFNGSTAPAHFHLQPTKVHSRDL